MRRKQGLADVGEPNEEECDSEEEEQGEGENPDGGPKTEQKIPNGRSTEEDCANVVRCNTGLPVRDGEQCDPVAGRAQRLRND